MNRSVLRGVMVLAAVVFGLSVLWILLLSDGMPQWRLSPGEGLPGSPSEASTEGLSVHALHPADALRREAVPSSGALSMPGSNGMQAHVLYDGGEQPALVPVSGATVEFGGRTLTTGGDGSFSLPRGAAKARIAKEGYLASEYDLIRISGLNKREPTDPQELWLCPGCTLDIQVSFEDGTPAEGALIQFSWSEDLEFFSHGVAMKAYISRSMLEEKRSPNSVPSAFELVMSETDEYGRLSLAALPGGYSQRLLVSAGGASEYLKHRFERGIRRDFLEVVLQKGWTVEGTYRDLDTVPGRAMNACRVELSVLGKDTVEIRSDPTGRFRFENCPPGWAQIKLCSVFPKVIPVFVDSDKDLGVFEYHSQSKGCTGRLKSAWPIAKGTMYACLEDELGWGAPVDVREDGTFFTLLPEHPQGLRLTNPDRMHATVPSAVWSVSPDGQGMEFDIDPLFALLRIQMNREQISEAGAFPKVNLRSLGWYAPFMEVVPESHLFNPKELLVVSETEFLLPHVAPGSYRVDLWLGERLAASWGPIRAQAGQAVELSVGDQGLRLSGTVRRADQGSVLGWRVAIGTGHQELARAELPLDGRFEFADLTPVPWWARVLDPSGKQRLEVRGEAAEWNQALELLVLESASLIIVCEDSVEGWAGPIVLVSQSPGSRGSSIASLPYSSPTGVRFEDLPPATYRVLCGGAFEPGVTAEQVVTLAGGEDREIAFSGHRGSAEISFMRDGALLEDVVQCHVRGLLANGELLTSELPAASPSSFRCPAGLEKAVFVVKRIQGSPLQGNRTLGFASNFEVALARSPIVGGSEMEVDIAGTRIDFYGDRGWAETAAGSVSVLEVAGIDLTRLIGGWGLRPESVEEGRVRMSPLPAGSVISVLAGPDLYRRELVVGDSLELRASE